MADKFIVHFSEVGRGDIPQVGGKGANLGELTQLGIRVPPGFIVTAQAYYHFLKREGLKDHIRQLLDSLDPADTPRLREVSSQLKQRLLQATMPEEIAQEIKRTYKEMGDALVAVRSSATAEDLPEASFAGQQRTLLNVQGEQEVVRGVQECWASLFEARAIFYRAQHGFDHLKLGIAVPVQRMVQSQASGVMFTVEPVSNDQNKVIIEAVLGLGEAIVSGEVTPDLYIVEKGTLKISEKRIGHQDWELVRNPIPMGGETNIKAFLPEAEQTRQKLPDNDIIRLARLGVKIEQHYQFPQDIEWAKDKDRLYILQTRPITTLKFREREEIPELKASPILTGVEASPGIASGPVKIVPKAELGDKVAPGDVLVAEMTTPDFVPAIKRAAAIITDKGGKTAHAAIVSRELGIPCVVGTGKATKLLQDGQVVTVDGYRGKVYSGDHVPQRIEAPTLLRRARIRTTTKVYVNLAEPELAEAVAAKDVDGVGLLRAEFIIARIGEHPLHMLALGRGGVFVDRLAQGLITFARAFHPRPVVYRTTDFKTNEYRNLKGGREYEAEEEENPMLGYRGCSRYIREREAFQLEIDAIKKVRESYDNLWVMVPFVRTVREMATTKQLLEEGGLKQAPDLKLWMMVEVPSNIFLLDKFLDVGIDGISIGSNDLTQLILGIDRDNPRLAEDFDERNEAVLLALEQAVRICKARVITSSICGQAPSFYPELTQKLVAWGITSVSVSPDMIEHTREIIAEAEARLATPSRLRRLVRSWELAEGA